jgi:hypothetical protein
MIDIEFRKKNQVYWSSDGWDTNFTVFGSELITKMNIVITWILLKGWDQKADGLINACGPQLGWAHHGGIQCTRTGTDGYRSCFVFLDSIRHGRLRKLDPGKGPAWSADHLALLTSALPSALYHTVFWELGLLSRTTPRHGDIWGHGWWQCVGGTQRHAQLSKLTRIGGVVACCPKKEPPVLQLRHIRSTSFCAASKRRTGLRTRIMMGGL